MNVLQFALEQVNKAFPGVFNIPLADAAGFLGISPKTVRNQLSATGQAPFKTVLRGGKAVTVIHRGSYDSIGKSYERLFARIESDKLNPIYPSREIYLKGPGLIFKGNPRNYVTELQVLVRED